MADGLADHAWELQEIVGLLEPVTEEIVMDLNQDVWDRLREQGHTIGIPYIQEGAGLFVVVDAVAMSVKDARALAHGHITLEQIKSRISQALSS